jgi:ankyrin repeat protein
MGTSSKDGGKTTKGGLSAAFSFPKPGEPLWDLYIAADDRNLRAIQKIFSEHPDLKTRDNLAIVLVNGIQGTRHDIIDYALAEKANVNFVGMGGMTPLGMAADKSDSAVFLKLLKAGASPTETDAINTDKPLRQRAMDRQCAEGNSIAKLLDNKNLMAPYQHRPQTKSPK